MITTVETARRFAQSIATQSVEAQDAIDSENWAKATDLVESVLADVEKLYEYVSNKLAQTVEE